VRSALLTPRPRTVLLSASLALALHLSALTASALRAEPRPKERGQGASKEQEVRFLPIVGHIAAIVADEERRANRDGIVCTGPGRHPSQAKRIAALIARLDEVTGSLYAADRRIYPEYDAILEALVREGDPAVEPLLRCLETDDRMRGLHGRAGAVCDAAFPALADILHVRGMDEFDWPGKTLKGNPARRVVAARLRAYWKKVRKVPLPMRCYAVLADDAATRRQWEWAAGTLTEQN
jgi:hypothetical protein